MGAAIPIRDHITAEELRCLARLETDGRVAYWLLGRRQRLGTHEPRARHPPGRHDRQTLRDWVIRFNAKGVEGLRDRTKSGPPPWLDDGQLAAFKALVLRGLTQSGRCQHVAAKDLCRRAQDRFVVIYSDNGMLQLLHDLDLSSQKMRRSTSALITELGRVSKTFPTLIAEIAHNRPDAERTPRKTTRG